MFVFLFAFSVFVFMGCINIPFWPSPISIAASIICWSMALLHFSWIMRGL